MRSRTCTFTLSVCLVCVLVLVRVYPRSSFLRYKKQDQLKPNPEDSVYKLFSDVLANAPRRVDPTTNNTVWAFKGARCDDAAWLLKYEGSMHTGTANAQRCIQEGAPVTTEVVDAAHRAIRTTRTAPEALEIVEKVGCN
jgi:hypothetical protein